MKIISDMYIQKHLTNRIIILLLFGLLLISCDRTKSMRGYDYIPDMMYSQAYDTYTQNPNFKDSMTNRVPVSGTIPIGFTPFRYTIDTISRAKAGEELVNPFTSTPEVLERGKLMFTTFCIVCHGEQGKGDGQIFKLGLYPLKPRDISAKPTARRPDGQIYHTITLGFGSMMPYGAQVRPEDRWKLVLYVRTLQKEAQEASPK